MIPDEIKDFSPSIIGISMTHDACFTYLESVVNTIRAHNNNITILLGGSATTYIYKEILNEGIKIDAICYGDGELPMEDYLRTSKFCKSWVTINNITPQKLLLPELDSVIDIDYSLIDINKYQREMIAENFSPSIKSKKEVELYCMTSRGCCYKCLFCNNSGNPDRKIRYASVDTIINHIESLIQKYGLNVISFFDEQILSDTIRAKELFKRLQPYNIKIKIPGGVTPVFIDEEMVDLMWNAGMNSITIAVESGSKKILKIMRKPTNLNQVRKLMKNLRKYDFFVRVNLVIGMPEETDDDRKETIDFIREIRPDLVAPNIASPILGSILREECIKRGYIKDIKIKPGMYNKSESVINTEKYSSEHIEEQFKYMIWQINFVENYRMSIGDFNSAKDYFQYVATRYPHEAFSWYYLNKAKEKLEEPQDWTEFNQCLQNNSEWITRFKNLGIVV
jgi:radical SAM superfamily enzyme YgiQ (UPF0313 family)